MNIEAFEAWLRAGIAKHLSVPGNSLSSGNFYRSANCRCPISAAANAVYADDAVTVAALVAEVDRETIWEFIDEFDGRVRADGPLYRLGQKLRAEFADRIAK